ncbi:MAG: SOS response-associated peptidase [Gammaproteobacteria bacterium]
MCGRFDRHRPVSAFTEVIDGVSSFDESLVPESYNVAPSQRAAAARSVDGRATLVSLQWGFVPAWSKNPQLSRPINARAETLAEKPMFRDAFRTGRCLILCDGYYEWRVAPGEAKQPFYITLESAEPFVMAGLWARNEGLQDGPIESFCVVTTEANESCRAVHHRMPLILEKKHHARWLESTRLDTSSAAVLLKVPDSRMGLTPVSRFVNSPANNGPQCIAPIETAGDNP